MFEYLVTRQDKDTRRNIGRGIVISRTSSRCSREAVWSLVFRRAPEDALPLEAALK